MSQRVVSTISSNNCSIGMPIFQSSGLVPIHNASFTVPSAQTSSQVKNLLQEEAVLHFGAPDDARASGGGTAQMQMKVIKGMLDPLPSRMMAKSGEVLKSSLTDATHLSSSSTLAHLLCTGNPRPIEFPPRVAVDRTEMVKTKSEVSLNPTSVSSTKTRDADIQFPHQSRGSVDYGPLGNFQSSRNQGVMDSASSRWFDQNQARMFQPMENSQSISDTVDPTVLEERALRQNESSESSRSMLKASQDVEVIQRESGIDMVKQDNDTKDWQYKKIEKEEDEGNEEWVTMENNPFNMRIVNMNNFPIAQSVYRTNYRSHSVACVRAKLGSIQNTAKSLDLLRQILQKSINADINAVIQKYLEEYFRPALENIRLNNGDNAVSVEHLHNVCRQILEEAKKMFNSDTRSTTPDIPDNASDSGSTDDARNIRLGRSSVPTRKRKLSSGSESSSCTQKTKKKNRFGSHLQTSSGRSTPSKKMEPVRREGPLWDAERIKSDTLFVMGARANKALGLGATRGRLYIKHPEIFKYSGDQDDKQWLYEKHLMPATGGKTYLLLVEDIKELAQSDEYRNSPGLLLDELVGFMAPEWMLEKMRNQMTAMRTDTFKTTHLSKEVAAMEALPRPSPANSDAPEMSTEQEYEDDSAAVSPLNETGGFNQELSPVPSQDPSELTNADEFDDDTPPLTGSFYVG